MSKNENIPISAFAVDIFQIKNYQEYNYTITACSVGLGDSDSTRLLLPIYGYCFLEEASDNRHTRQKHICAASLYNIT